MEFRISAPHIRLTVDARAYIEFRVFSAIAPVAPSVGVVRVDLTTRAIASGPEAFTCAVHAGTTAATIVARGSSHHLLAAVDAAARRLAVAVEHAVGRPEFQRGAQAVSR